MWIGAAVGAFIGWVVGAALTKGPKTPIEAFTGDFEAGGPGCFGFLLLVALGAGAGAIIGALMGSA